MKFEVTYHLFPYTRWKELTKQNTFGAKILIAFIFYLHLHFKSWIKKRTFAQKATHYIMNTQMSFLLLQKIYNFLQEMGRSAETLVQLLGLGQPD